MYQYVSLMYHNVCPQPAVDGLWPGFEQLSRSVTGYFVDRQTFSRHCTMIARLGSPLETLAESAAGDVRPGVQITFDDGWRGTFEQAGPILTAHGLNALVFVTTDLIGHPHFADRQQLASAAPTFVIGSHARTHRQLSNLNNHDIREELTTSKHVLEDLLGSEVDRLAFPGGSYDRRVVEISREVGYRQLYTSKIRRNLLAAPQNLIGRVAIKSGTNDAVLRRYISGHLLPEQCRAMALSGIKKILGRRGIARARSVLLAEKSTQLKMLDLAAAAACRIDQPPLSSLTTNLTHGRH